MNNQLLTTVQEVYFDLCDAIENHTFSGGDLPQEFKSAEEWLQEQKTKLEQIEAMLLQIV